MISPRAQATRRLRGWIFAPVFGPVFGPVFAPVFAPVFGLVFALAATALLAGGLARSALAEALAEGTPVVVELFTSQGCNACPPADTFMGELAKRDDVIGLSFHVDYWDYIGWKDTFAKSENTQRQKAYGQVLGHRYVYTPQMVIGGKKQAAGSKRERVEQAIDYVGMDAPAVHVTTKRSADGVSVRLAETKLDAEAWVWLVRFDKRHDVAVRRGENAGQTLSYFNVVRTIERIAVWNGRAAEFPIDIAQMRADGRDGCAVIVQSAGYGPILGATRIDLSDPS